MTRTGTIAVLNRLAVLLVLGAGMLWPLSCLVGGPRPVARATGRPDAPTAPAAPLPAGAAPARPPGQFSKGRGLTPSPKAAFAGLPLLERMPNGELNDAARLRYADRGTMRPTAIVLHSASGMNAARTVAALEARGAAVHFLVDDAGRAWQLMDSLEEQGRAARGLDDAALHVEILGASEKALLDNRPQFRKVVELLRALVYRYDIPAHNYDVASKRGIFSHAQAIKRFGGFSPGDPLHPGEDYVKASLTALGGTYFEEKDWKDRAEEGWHFIVETSQATAKRGKLAKGRGITPAPKAELPELERTRDGSIVEDRRLQYVDRGKIPVTGVVLHFTATEMYEKAQQVLEDRRLCPTIMVDDDGKAYQCLDALDDRPAAAAETNAFAIQIEIVGMGEAALLENALQKAKVIRLVRRLCDRYAIPRTNADIDSGRGVFSHGQQKKRWGHSATLHPGHDFDPGEKFMKEVLEGIGGTYVPEAEWKGRSDEAWVIVWDDWTP